MPKLYGWVREVTPDSPADLAGVQPGDLLRQSTAIRCAT
jgi:hypothetical protein